ncbi:hypothetical protein SAMN04490209_5000 [Pseudomonas rhodesiae]|uniref:Uncharacterized protein n=1 Tax=Pseudomonas rhodesiae TaxID=76760 RepID=A0AAE8HH28_9PSED|nr:hypothetical protein SAMN04490209_5000 [Pseudomonas rhodesiae]
MVELSEREKMLDEAWSEPVQAVGTRYGLSNVGC